MIKRKDPSPPDEPSPKGGAGASPLEEARAAIEAGNYSHASGLLKLLLDKEPGHEPARQLSAQLHLKSGSLMAAKAAFEVLAREAMQRREFAKAESYLREYLAAASRYVPFLELLGQACEAQGKTAESVSEFAKAVTILLEFPDPEDRAHAERIYGKVTALAPDHPDVVPLAAAFAPPPPPPAVAPMAPLAEPVVAATPEKPLVGDPGPSSADPVPTAAQPQAQAGEDPSRAVQSDARPIVESPAPPVPEPSVEAPPTSDLREAVPAAVEETVTTASATPEPLAMGTDLLGVSPVHEASSVGPDIRSTRDGAAAYSAADAAPSQAPVVAEPFEAPPAAARLSSHESPQVALAPRRADLVPSELRSKSADQVDVEVISLEEWMHEPLSPEPLGRDKPRSAVAASRKAISLPDQTGTAGLLAEHTTGNRSLSSRTAEPREATPSLVEASLQRGLAPAVSSPTPAEGARPFDLSHPDSEAGPPIIVENASLDSRRPDDVGSQTEQQARPEYAAALDPGLSSGALSDQPPGPPVSDLPLIHLAGPELESEAPRPAARAIPASVAPIASIDPTLMAELETFMREKTPLTERTGVSPYASATEIPREQEDSVVSPPVQAESPASHQASPESSVVEQQEGEVAQPLLQDEVAQVEPTATPIETECLAAEPLVFAESEVETAPIAEASVVLTSVQGEPVRTEARAAKEFLSDMSEPESLGVVSQSVVALDGTEENVPVALDPEPETAPEPVDLTSPSDREMTLQMPEPEPLTTEEALDEPLPPVEESTWEPVSESDEDVVRREEWSSAVEPEPVPEPMPQTNHEHEIHPCALCQEAEAEEQARASQSSPMGGNSALATSGRRRRPFRPLRRVSRWVRAGLVTVTDVTVNATRIAVRLILLLTTMGVGLPLFTVSLIAATWLAMEQKPNEAFLELTQAPPRAAEEPTRNGYFLLLGFGASESVDPLKAGYAEWKTAERDHTRQCFDQPLGTRAPVSFVSDTRTLALWFQSQDPVGEFMRERGLVQRWVAQHHVLMGRYRDWLAMPFEDRGYGNFASPDCAQVLTAHRLYLAGGFAHRAADGMDRLEKDLIAWRNVLARSKTMATKLLAAQVVKEDVTILAAVVGHGSSEVGALPRFAHLIRPFDQVERSLRWPMQNELLLEVRRVASGLPEPRHEEPDWLTSMVTHLPVPKQRTLNAHADYYAALIHTPDQAGQTLPDPYTFTNSPAQDAIDYFVNPVDNLLLSHDHQSWQHEASVLSDADKRLRELIVSRAFQPRSGAPLTAKAQPQSVEVEPTLVSESSNL